MEHVQVTTEGRVIGIALMICGVGMFAGLSGLLASLFLGGQDRKTTEMKEVLAKLAQIEARLAITTQEQAVPLERNKSG